MISINSAVYLVSAIIMRQYNKLYLNIMFILCLCACGLFKIRAEQYVNNNGNNLRPILGILTQEVSYLVKEKYPDKNFTSYIAASYVKFVESSGCRVVPIWIGKTRAYYEDIMSKVNGILLPGGSTYFNATNGYFDAGRFIYEIAMEKNEQGNYFPLWGTCLGFELLVYLSANCTEPRTSCSSSNQPLPLEFITGYEKSRMFGNASEEIIHILKEQPVTSNFHMFCFTQETFSAMNLDKLWNVMSVNHDKNGIQFISTIEHKKYPFYGTQFHPEKNIFEFTKTKIINHSPQAVLTSQYFANFIVNEARLNHQYFLNETEEQLTLIYNYAPIYTGLIGSAFVQQYLFEEYVSQSGVNIKSFSILIIFYGLAINVYMTYYRK